MKNIIEKYKALTVKKQIIVCVGIFILALMILPHALVYAVGAYASYKLITKKVWRNTLITILCISTFFSFVLWFGGDVQKYTEKSGENSKQNISTSTNSTSTVNENTVTDSVKNSLSSIKSIFNPQNSSKLYSVVKVVDGDTVDVSIDGKTERLRLIGINTPETVDPRKPVECFGVEASNKAKSILSGKKVILESESSQGERDKYDRLLRYVFLEDGTNFNLSMIKEGYAYEYTFDVPYKYQTEFKKAQKDAQNGKVGLWGDICQTSSVAKQTTTVAPTTASTNNSGSCTIKGNISSSKEKIYHMIGCGSYAKTTIDESAGEKWFCTEREALEAGWRKALNCG